MVEFNPDGSIKLPEHLAKNRSDNQQRLRSQRCIKIKREILSTKPPKKCLLHITLSEAISDSRFITNIFDQFKERASVPLRLISSGPKEFNIEVGTDFKRCSDCSALIGQYKEFLDGNVIEEFGSCQFEDRRRKFCDEDYFD